MSEQALPVRIVLVGTTHPGNIGAVARAMKNMGLEQLALVNPKTFPSAQAVARASGATDILNNAQVHTSLDDAVADCGWVIGTSARRRSIAWPTLLARDAATEVLQRAATAPVAVVFGPEKTGLSNEDMDRCAALVAIPTTEFSSLNLAMAVQVIAYELFVQRDDFDVRQTEDSPPATAQELEHLYNHIERLALDSGFLNPENPRYLMRRLRRLFARATPDQNEVNILRGLLAQLESDRWRKT
ncbi:MAG: RNA methyltransferase [Pseudomonadota bacterium]